MSKQAVIKGLAMLSAAYMKEIPDQTIALYVSGLCEIDDGLLLGSIEDIIVTSKYFPTIADIRDGAVARALPAGRAPTKESAWHEVTTAIKTVGHVQVTYPDCDRCRNSRLVVYETDTAGVERYGRCHCVLDLPAAMPDWSHPMIGETVVKIGGYNSLTSLSDRGLSSARSRFFDVYQQAISRVTMSIYADKPETRRELYP